jgi:uncharacterized protein
VGNEHEMRSQRRHELAKNMCDASEAGLACLRWNQLFSHGATLPRVAPALLGASLWLLPGAGLAFAVRDVSNPRQSHGGWVSDGAGILRPDTESRIDGMISALERQDSSELMVVTVPDTSGSSSPKTFATELFNTFKIGKKGVDNGVLMLISKGDRRVEIETGYGMEERLPDARAGAIIRSAMTPRFKQGDFDGGTLAGVGEVISSLSPDAEKHSPTADKPTASTHFWTRPSFWDTYGELIIMSMMVLSMLLLHKLGLLSSGSSSSGGGGGGGDWGGGGGGDWGGGGGGGGGGSDSGGGGSSGGGGAGDSW